MTQTKQAPEIFQRRIDDLDLPGLPPRGTPAFDQALISHFALQYAGRGWNALVTVDDEYVRVLAIPENGIEPKAYVLGLLQHRFLDYALPLLHAMSGMGQGPVERPEPYCSDSIVVGEEYVHFSGASG